MSLSVGSSNIAKVSVGTTDIAKISIGTTEIFSSAAPPPAPSLLHTLSIIAGINSGWVGWWDGRAGQVTNGRRFNPPGRTDSGANRTQIRQTMFERGSGQIVRFLLNRPIAPITTSDLDQFPAEIEIQHTDGDKARFVPQDPVVIASFGQGVGQDYIRKAGETVSVDMLLVDEAAADVRLYY